MRVKCQSFEEFIECLENLEKDGETLEAGIIRVSNSFRPVDEYSRFVDIQITTIINLPSGGQYLLECGIFCGKDFDDSGGDKQGTRRSEWFRNRLSMIVSGKPEWRIRPGIIEI